MDATSTTEQTEWAEELRLQLEATSANLSNEESDDSPVQLELSQAAFETLSEAIDEILAGNSDTASDATCSGEPLTRAIDAIDASMASWRSQIELSLAESTTRQLDEHLKQAALLNSQVAERETQVAQRESQLAEHTSKLDQELAGALRLQARTERQRKTLAETLKRQRAELLLELAQQREQQQENNQLKNDELHASINELRLSLEQSKAKNEQLENNSLSGQQRESDLAAEIELLNEKLTELESQTPAEPDPALQQTLEKLEQENTSLREQLASQRDQLEAEMDVENARLLQSIATLNEKVEQGEERSRESDKLREEALACSEEAEKLKLELEELKESSALVSDDTSGELREAREQITLLQAQIDDKDEQLANQPAETDDEALSDLQGQLSDALEQIDSLKLENARLAEAEHSMPPGGNSPHVSFNQESLSWEERKKLILEQLECDDAPQTAETEATKVEVESILATTQAEIDRRDRDIEELQTIIEQQSDTKQGVAIGAAAIAQMFDEDTLVVEEREKLKSLQGEWEDKVRQAEIDISMERAKLARQRSEVESKVAELESQLAKHGGTLPPPEVVEPGGGRTRKWLEHLGLKEDDPS